MFLTQFTILQGLACLSDKAAQAKLRAAEVITDMRNELLIN